MIHYIGANDLRLRESKVVLFFMLAWTSAAILFLSAITVSASDLGQPQGPVILEVTGNIGTSNQAQSAAFDLAMLEKLGLTTVKTSTVWTDGGARSFEGVLARDVMAAVGAKEARTVVARALNDYTIEIPVVDFHEYDVIFAMRMDGQLLTARDKGPLWVVYPRDDHPELQDERIDQRWAWQLKALEVR